MSHPPNAPGTTRDDVKYRLRPFFETVGKKSPADELTTGPRLIGVDQPKNRRSRADATAIRKMNIPRVDSRQSPVRRTAASGAASG
jgi:hypothetical protein